MAPPVPNPPPGFEGLSVDQKLEYVESLWDQIAEHVVLPLPDWHLELLRERLEAYRVDPAAGRPWSEVRAELEQKYPAGR